MQALAVFIDFADLVNLGLDFPVIRGRIGPTIVLRSIMTIIWEILVFFRESLDFLGHSDVILL